MTREVPILFSAPMVRAILRNVNPKTVTRRIIKPQPKHALIEGLAHVTVGMPPEEDGLNWYDADGINPGRLVRCKYRTGDRLWVREAWSPRLDLDDTDSEERRRRYCRYKADGGNLADEWHLYDRWRSPIHMPRWASRITLEVVSVRAEMVQDITPADAVAEGWPGATERVKCCEGGCAYSNVTCGDMAAVIDNDDAIEWFADLWNTVNGKGSWESNPWVWRIEFRRIKCGARQ